MSKFWSSNGGDSDAPSSASCADDESDDNDSVDWDSESSDEEEDDSSSSCSGSNNNPGGQQINVGDPNIDDDEGFHSIAMLSADPFSNNSKPSTTAGRQHKQQQEKGESFSAKSALATTDDAKNDPNFIWERIKNDQRFEPVPTTKKEERSPHGARKSTTRIVLMSDTHGRHDDIPYLPKGDVLIHGGDFTKSGEIGTVQSLSTYFEKQQAQNQFDKIICIAGNHELTFQPEFYQTARRRHKPTPFDPYETRAALTNCIYLEDESITIATTSTENDDDQDPGSIEVYGSPWTPAFYDWAFNLPRGEALDQVWSKIPSSTDILVTHGPPLGRCDFTDHSGRAGCYELVQHVQNRIQPRLHVFGHLHSSYGTSFDGHTLYVNASNLDSDTETIASKPCIVVDLPHDKSQSAQIVQPSCTIQTLGDLLTWLKQRSYSKILEACGAGRDDLLAEKVPFPEAFYNESAFFDLCGVLNLLRDKSGREELRRAVCQIYAESF